MRRIINFVAITLGIGILLGILTSFGQTYIPEPLTQLANSYSVWLFFSLIAGYLLNSVKRAALSGALLQYIAILFYYVASSIRFDMDYSIIDLLSVNLIWIIGGTLVGPVAGIAGVLIRQNSRHVAYAIAFMAGLFISEAVFQFINLKYIGEGIVFVIAALAFLSTAYYKTRFSVVKTILVSILFVVIMYVGYAFVLGNLFQ